MKRMKLNPYKVLGKLYLFQKTASTKTITFSFIGYFFVTSLSDLCVMTFSEQLESELLYHNGSDTFEATPSTSNFEELKSYVM